MKRLLKTIVFILVVVLILFTVVLIYTDLTEWTLRGEIYEVMLPIKINDGTIAEIEEQTRKEALKKYPDSYLGEISWISSSDEGFNSLSEGSIVFTYCENLGNCNGFYSYDRFALCDVIVDLDKKQITRIDIGGNNQLGGLGRLETYPEFLDIRNIMHKYLMLMETDQEAYSVISSHVNILRDDYAMVNFKIKLSNGTERNVKGQLKKYENGYKFLKQAEKSVEPINPFD